MRQRNSCFFSRRHRLGVKRKRKKKGNNIGVYPPLNSPPNIGGRRGVLASDATTETLGSPRSAEGFSPRRGGGGIKYRNNTPSASLVPLPLGGDNSETRVNFYIITKKKRGGQKVNVPGARCNTACRCNSNGCCEWSLIDCTLRFMMQR